MVDKDFVKNLSVKWQTSEINILREYVQHNFLANLYKPKQAGKLFFKGGTALRIVYQSPRFSEDLDFSSLIASVETIEELIENTLTQLQHQAINLEISEAKPTAGGYLFEAKTNLLGKKISIKLNFVFKKKVEGEVIFVPSVFLPPYNLVLLKKEDLVGEKIEALLRRHKIRDFFDLYYILRARLGIKAVINRKDKILKLIEKTKNNFVDLKPFLPKNFWPIIKELRKNLITELNQL